MCTYEAGGVVVTDGLGVSVGLKYWVSLHNLVLQWTLLVAEGQRKNSVESDRIGREVNGRGVIEVTEEWKYGKLSDREVKEWKKEIKSWIK